MKKQKTRFLVLAFLLLLVNIFWVSKTFAAASATVSWTPPTTDEGGGALTGLAGYKVYYNTTSTWLNYLTACILPDPVGSSVEIDVPGASTSSYYFENSLTPGQTYYFAVAAYDEESTPNVSKCATGGGLTEVSKQVSYTADIDTTGGSLHKVDLLDFNAFRSNWGNTNCSNIANFTEKNSNCAVNLLDFNILRADFGSSF